MKNKYYDTWEFRKALSFAEDNPVKSKKQFEEYLQKYPKDYSAYPYYAGILIVLKQFEEAEKILNWVENKFKKSNNFAHDYNKIKLLENNILSNRLKLLVYQGKFDELYRLCVNNEEEIKNMNLNQIYFYCKKKIGMLDSLRRDNNSYLFRQIIEYKESDFLDYIKSYLADYNQDIDTSNKKVFSYDFPINEIIEEIKKYIPSNKGLCNGFVENMYIFKYDECGKDNNKLVDYFKVVCFHNTQEFITIFPISKSQDLEYIDLNYLKPDTNSNKVKIKSQIDKFNQRRLKNQK